MFQDNPSASVPNFPHMFHTRRCHTSSWMTHRIDWKHSRYQLVFEPFLKSKNDKSTDALHFPIHPTTHRKKSQRIIPTLLSRRFVDGTGGKIIRGRQSRNPKPTPKTNKRTRLARGDEGRETPWWRETRRPAGTADPALVTRISSMLFSLPARK